MNNYKWDTPLQIGNLPELDLASLDSIKSFADSFRQPYSRLDHLINNAGIMAPPFEKTANGFEVGNEYKFL
ncbi:MAG: hypothetical protein GY729_07345 [Desulfobacteraceae bacterium]|nr:hypothetical protein [Desulfobacteraceae bacterium]